MQRERLIDSMVTLLKNTLVEGGADQGMQVSASSPLIGAEAVLTSLALVSFITDVEATLAEAYNIEFVLVSEQALSRKNSPFLTIEALADYILELAGAPVENETAVKK